MRCSRFAAAVLLALHAVWCVAQENPDNPLVSGAQLLRAGKVADAVVLLLPLAQAGNVFAIHYLGMAVAKGGVGVERNMKKAAALFQTAERGRFLPSIFNLGLLYQEGDGVERDYQEALARFKLAARYGFTPALVALARLHETGLGVQRDPVAAYAYLLVAAKLGSADAEKALHRVLLKVTDAQIAQAKVLADNHEKRVTSDVKACEKMLAQRNNLPYDDEAPPRGNLMFACFP
jgi:TPR repeat protein